MYDDILYHQKLEIPRMYEYRTVLLLNIIIPFPRFIVYYRMQWTVVVVCIYFVHLYFAHVFSSRIIKHPENVLIYLYGVFITACI